MYEVDGLCADHNNNNNKLLRVNGIDRKFKVVVLDRLRNEPVICHVCHSRHHVCTDCWFNVLHIVR